MIKEVSILIVTYKTPDLIKDNIANIEKNCIGVDYEVIVVDNGSNDKTSDIIKTEFPFVTLLTNSKNVYYSPALNQAAQKGKGKYLLILNSDLFLAYGALRRMIDVMEINSDIGCMTSALEENDVVSYNFWDRRDAWDFAINRVPFSIFNKKKKISKTVISKVSVNNETISIVDIVTDACLLIRNEIFKEIKGYDEKMLMYFTEDDLCIKVSNLNYSVGICETVVNKHKGSFSTKKEKSKIIFNLEADDKYEYLKKYFGTWNAFFSRILSCVELLFLKLSGKMK